MRRKIWLVGFIVVAVAGLSARVRAAATEAARHPNVVVIVADDQGWNGVGYHHGFARTPNIDRIAHDGVQLDKFYVSPMCSPTRAGLLTGRYALHLGMGRSVVRPWAHFGLPTDARTIPDVLADAGYKDRAAFGKWHLGHLDPKWHPLARGFTSYIGCYNGAADYFTRDRDGQVDWHDGYKDIDPQGYTTDIIGQDAEQFIRGHKKSDGPFFAYVAFTAVHEPAQAKEEDIRKYPDLGGEKQTLAAQTDCMDQNIGRILQAIEDAGIKDQTLVWFLSDNGGIGAIPGNNAPLRGAKLTCYEGGVRVPAAVWWPGVIDGGRKLEAPMLNVDLMPTLAAVCGATAPADVDGANVWDALAGKGDGPRRDVYSFQGQQGLEREDIAVMSADNWKLLVHGPDVRRAGGIDSPGHRVELFDLSADPDEKNDLSKQQPARVKELAAKLVAFRNSEPPDALEPINRKPQNFKIPPHWHNAPEGK